MVLDCVCIYVCECGGHSNAGDEAAPFKTIGRALAAATPPALIRIKPGTYTESLTIDKSGIILEGLVEGGQGVTIRAPIQGEVPLAPMAFYDRDGDQAWDPEEPIWEDRGPESLILDAGDRVVYDFRGQASAGMPGTDLPQARFADRDTSQGWDQGEAFWLDAGQEEDQLDREDRLILGQSDPVVRIEADNVYLRSLTWAGPATSWEAGDKETVMLHDQHFLGQETRAGKVRSGELTLHTATLRPDQNIVWSADSTVALIDLSLAEELTSEE